MMQCAVIDYGLGNVFSVKNALNKIGVDAYVTSDPDKIRNAPFAVLPGVGAFGQASERVVGQPIGNAFMERVSANKPSLGICVGMQLLFEEGLEFGRFPGLGLMSGRVCSVLDQLDDKATKVPLIGWMPLSLNMEHPAAGLFADLPDFYFVHSYSAQDINAVEVVAKSENGIVAAVARGNLMGVQFHPERSGEHGLSLLKRFFERASE